SCGGWSHRFPSPDGRGTAPRTDAPASVLARRVRGYGVNRVAIHTLIPRTRTSAIAPVRGSPFSPWEKVSGALERVEPVAQVQDLGEFVQGAAGFVEEGGIGQVRGLQFVAVPGGGPDRQAGVE